ncbi:MAG: hypothetical protein ABWY95_03835 [Thermoleophilaceae bacterium]
MATTLIHPTRGRAFLRRGALARRLAAGASPSDSPELARRAEQLCSARNRRALARGLERVIDAAEERPHPYSSAVPLRRAAVLEAREGMLELAAELRDTNQGVNVRGIALVERMLTDGGSPLYMQNDEESLGGAISHARAALLLA